MGGIHEIADLMPGALNYVKFANIKEGEDVLIIPSTDADEIVVQAVIAAVKTLGADVTVAYAPPPELYFKEASRCLGEAMCAADTVLDVGSFVFGHSDASITAIVEYLTKGSVLSPPPTPAILKSPAALYPLELHYAVEAKVHKMCQQPDGTEITLTSPGGTNLSAKVWQNRTGGGWAQLKGLAPGEFSIFPPGMLGFMPPRYVNGVAFFEAYTGFGKCSKPLKFTIENSYVTKIEGGWEAKALSDRIKGIDQANFLCEIMFGVNPKNRVDLKIKPVSFEAERSPRTLHLGTGDIKQAGGPIRCSGKDPRWKTVHQDGFMLYPTLKVGGQTILEKGHLTVLDDPEIIDLASKFGDPEEVLSYSPVYD